MQWSKQGSLNLLASYLCVCVCVCVCAFVCIHIDVIPWSCVTYFETANLGPHTTTSLQNGQTHICT